MSQAPVDPLPATTCASCSGVLQGEWCSACGEKRLGPRDLGLFAIAGDVLGGLFSLDGRIPRTVRTLMFQPGALTRAWAEGRRVGYTRPFSLFLVLSLVFFLVQPHTGMIGYGYQQLAAGSVGSAELRAELALKQTRSGLGEPAFAERFDGILQGQKQSLFVALIPFFACLSALTHFRSRSPFVVHVVFAIHHCVVLLLLLVLVFLAGLILPNGVLDRVVFRPLPILGPEGGFVVFLLLTTGTYLVFASRRAFPGTALRGWAQALAAGLSLFAGQIMGFVLYQRLILTVAVWLV
ncbi:MAG: DUF3667 domain-containing protein [Planctomycetes bacterium]|nr:DUF3667 domain-containing protein [Planctomycetota bacterium]